MAIRRPLSASAARGLRGALLATGFAAALLGGVACSVSAPAPEQPAPKPMDPRARLDEIQRLSADRNYDAAMAAFETMQEENPEAITSLDGLKMVTVYAEVGELEKHEALTKWLIDRYRNPTTATDAERSVKGYIVHGRAKNPEILKHAVEMTRFASERAKADKEEEYQGFFDTSRGIALYRTGRYADASKWLFSAIEHPDIYVRTLALPFLAMSEAARGNRQQLEAISERARAEAAKLPVPGTDEYVDGWTDVLISRRALDEMLATIRK